MSLAASEGGRSPLAVVLADPALAQAAAATLETAKIATPRRRRVSGSLGLPAGAPAAAVVLVHEWWGLNNQVKAIAAELAGEGYVALAVDLFDGRVATTAEEAQALAQALRPDEALDTVVAWIRWLKDHDRVTGGVATLGWCLGGAWALDASLAEPVDATVIYYGRCAKSAAELAPLAGPVLGHFANRDQHITPAMVDGFESALKGAGKPHTIYRYDADHAFANPTGARYDAEDAALAWSRTLGFLEEALGT